MQSGPFQPGPQCGGPTTPVTVGTSPAATRQWGSHHPGPGLCQLRDACSVPFNLGAEAREQERLGLRTELRGEQGRCHGLVGWGGL